MNPWKTPGSLDELGSCTGSQQYFIEHVFVDHDISWYFHELIFKLMILMIIIIVIISSITNFPWLLNWWWGENLFPMIFRSPGSRLPTYSTPKPSTLDTQHTDLLPWTCWMWPGCDQDGAIDINLTWLFTESAWWFGCHQLYFPICIGIIIPIDELIFFGGVAQPPTRNK